MVEQSVDLDLAALRIEGAHRGVGLFTATHIKVATANGGVLRYFTVSVLLKLLELFITSQAHASSETNVFLGADCEVALMAMTVNEGRSAAEKYRDVLIYLDEIPAKDELNQTAHDQCMFLRNLMRCLALPCLLSGTESTMLDVVSTARGSRCEGREPWAWLLTKFPATRLNLQTARFGDYEQHLLCGARPLFIHWFAESSDAAAAPVRDGSGRICVTPETLPGGDPHHGARPY